MFLSLENRRSYEVEDGNDSITNICSTTVLHYPGEVTAGKKPVSFAPLFCSFWAYWHHCQCNLWVWKVEIKLKLWVHFCNGKLDVLTKYCFPACFCGWRETYSTELPKEIMLFRSAVSLQWNNNLSEWNVTKKEVGTVTNFWIKTQIHKAPLKHSLLRTPFAINILKFKEGETLDLNRT